jgi:hypothetical protein
MTMSAETTRAAHTIQPMNKLRSVYGKLESPLGDCTGTQLQVHDRRDVFLGDQVVQIGTFRRRSSVLHEQAWQELMHQLRFDQPKAVSNDRSSCNQCVQGSKAPRRHVSWEDELEASKPARRQASVDDLSDIAAKPRSRAHPVSNKPSLKVGAGDRCGNESHSLRSGRRNDPDASSRPAKTSCGTGAMQALIRAIGLFRH